MTEQEKIDLDVRNVIANAHFEGFDLTEEEIDNLYKVRRGELKSEDVKAMYLNRLKSRK
jgi:hypothetical protein